MPGGLDTAFVCRAEDLTAGFRTNVIGPALVAQAFGALVAKSGEKTIVNVSSTLGSIGTGCGQIAASYCVTKAALNMLVSRRWRASGYVVQLTILGTSTDGQAGEGASGPHCGGDVPRAPPDRCVRLPMLGFQAPLGP